MRRLTEGAERAKDLLKRENSPLPAECEQVIVSDLEKTLSAYFTLEGKIKFQFVRKDEYTITIVAKALQVKPFGIVKG